MKKIDRNPTFRERRAVNWDESLLLPFRNNPQCCTCNNRDADRGRRDVVGRCEVTDMRRQRDVNLLQKE